MRKLYIFGLVGLAAVIIGLAWADHVTFTTYYPAPYGVYNDMRVMNSLGVGTTDPNRTLHIAGTEGIRLEPSALPNPARVGDIAIDSGDNNILKWHDGTDWQPLGASSGRVVGGGYQKEDLATGSIEVIASTLWGVAFDNGGQIGCLAGTTRRPTAGLISNQNATFICVTD